MMAERVMNEGLVFCQLGWDSYGNDPSRRLQKRIHCRVPTVLYQSTILNGIEQQQK